MKVSKYMFSDPIWRDTKPALPKGYGMLELTFSCVEMYEGKAPL